MTGQAQSPSRPTVLGVDGCRGAWVAAEVVGRDVRWHHGRLAALVDAAPAAEVVGVDMPIGLPTSGRRRCDEAGRLALPGAAARLFHAPPAYAYEADDQAAANHALAGRGEKGVSAQSFALRHAVAEAAAVARDDPRLVEVHPELSFLALAGRVLPAKRSAAGAAARVEALAGWLGTDVVLEALACCPRGVPLDDALDALAVAWTALRVVAGTARCYPADPRRGEPVIRA